ncbi:MAG: COX15/CtaA family protein [Parvibaculaceae bacterium]|nr:COX15/CtaA family protein [Parvibaculaceae bacterium]
MTSLDAADAVSRSSGGSGRHPARRAVALWLFGVAALVMAMVLVGGLTRLTGSGLSITEWKPVTGALPPLSDMAWQAEFQKYQQIPQYRLVNEGMSLSEFKAIYFWEWGHRLLGRLIGVVFAVPFVWFLLTKRIERAMVPRLVLMFVLGGMQGLLGWYMVKSGLIERVSVSQYRLVAHLGLAVLIYAYICWIGFSLWRGPAARMSTPVPAGVRAAAYALAVLVYLQILLGGFVAGTDAGFIYNSWPLIKGAFIPEGLFFITPAWRNLFENVLTVQFDHRMMAYAITLCVAAFWVWLRRLPHSGLRRSGSLLILAVLAQVGLGIWTLLEVVPIPLGAAHQIGAMVVFSLALWNAHTASR